ncbi:alpha-ketoglutarate-dependent dioxygenase AlkB [Microcoleus sp. LAD1_D3]|uniref:alpha-ketoglutarate-dependent dioxygenase AlkB n=1 Tax=Microcoleus sp. LAD1_D3 TaxID=2819365 RepID=UPI002FD1B316
MLHLKNYFSPIEQEQLVQLARKVCEVSPMITPVMPSGHKFNCQMTSCGPVGWTSDLAGYQYSKIHPVTKKPFAAMPTELTLLAKKLANLVDEPDYRPDTCLINYYPANNKSKLGLHQDNSESNLKPAIISISIGDDCVFAIGTTNRRDPVREILLTTGDVLIMHKESRLAYHSVKRIIANSSNILKNNGRLNFTIRQVY